MAAGAALVLVRIFAARAPLESVDRTYPALRATTSLRQRIPRALAACPGVRATLISPPRVTRERASAGRDGDNVGDSF